MAALEIAQTEHGEEIIQIAYPKIYLSLIDNLLSSRNRATIEKDLNTTALLSAVGFLQSVPITSQTHPTISKG